MLPKSRRITTQDFKGKKTRLAYRGAFFDMSIAPGEKTKYACIISKKRVKRAVDRNRIKRRIYTSLKDMDTKTPLFVFIYPTKTSLHASQASLHDELKKAFATLS